MKLKKIKVSKSKLIKFQLIKFKTYKQNKGVSDKNIQKFNFEYIELHLKKALQLIYSYHLNNKKIFFIGVPFKLKKKFFIMLKKTKHLFVPESTWIKGVLSNKISIFQYLNKQIKSNIKTTDTNLKFLLTIQEKPDLIVLLNQEIEPHVFQESIKLKIPIVAITTSLKSNKKIFYPIHGNFEFLNKKFDNIFFLLLKSIINKQK